MTSNETSDDTSAAQLHEQMQRLVGTWRTEGRFIDGGENHGETWHGHDIYEWFAGERQMVHRVDVHIFGARKEAIEFFTPRAGATGFFDQTSFDADGSVERGVGSFDNEGRYVNDAGEARAVLSFDSPEYMQATWKLCQPDGSWADWMHVTFTRIAPPHIEVRSKDDHSV